MSAIATSLLETLAPQIVDISIRAGKAILEVYGQAEIETTLKDNDSPLTQADLAANTIITDALKHLDPAFPILSEESKEIPYEERQSWETFWLVDPLDGTKEFIKRNGEFTVNIALVSQGKPILGVVHAPVLDTTYWGASGLSAFKQVAGAATTPIQVTHAPVSSGTTLNVVASRSHAGKETQDFLDKLTAAGMAIEVVSKGSSLKLCLVAEGTAQLYPRFGPTMEWDTAAAQAVVEHAGGTVSNIDGSPLSYNKPNLLNPYFVVSDASGLNWKAYAN
ncbi:MAG: 3'(2'),5'-bisphosphate nucleotidase CysQ [Cyanobacteria bacterium P01_F01_bin.33]